MKQILLVLSTITMLAPAGGPSKTDEIKGVLQQMTNAYEKIILIFCHLGIVLISYSPLTMALVPQTSS